MTTDSKDIEVTQEMVDAALNAHVPGGSDVWVWLPQMDAWTPHETARVVIECALKAALPIYTAQLQAERDELVALLRKARGYVEAVPVQHSDRVWSEDLLTRIDALLKIGDAK